MKKDEASDPKSFVDYVNEIRNASLTRVGTNRPPMTYQEDLDWELKMMLVSHRLQIRHCESRIEQIRKLLRQRSDCALKQQLHQYEMWRNRCKTLLIMLTATSPP